MIHEEVDVLTHICALWCMNIPHTEKGADHEEIGHDIWVKREYDDVCKIREHQHQYHLRNNM